MYKIMLNKLFNMVNNREIIKKINKLNKKDIEYIMNDICLTKIFIVKIGLKISGNNKGIWLGRGSMFCNAYIDCMYFFKNTNGVKIKPQTLLSNYSLDNLIKITKILNNQKESIKLKQYIQDVPCLDMDNISNASLEQHSFLTMHFNAFLYKLVDDYGFVKEDNFLEHIKIKNKLDNF